MKDNFICIPVEDMQYYIRLKTGEIDKATHIAFIPYNGNTHLVENWNYTSKEDIVYLKSPITDSRGNIKKIEYVYILINESLPGMIKIGMTTDTPEKRARDINTTGVPTPWICVWSMKCYASRILEQRVHEYLGEYRVAENREMFNIDSLIAQHVIEDLGRDFTNCLLAERIEQHLR